MISLPKIVASDADTSIFGQSAKGDAGAQDFLALLAGALGDGALKGDNALSMADLQAASARLQKGVPNLAADDDGKLALTAKLNELLAQQETLADDSLAQLTSGQGLLNGLTTTPLKTDALSALTKNASRGASLTTDIDSGLSEEELAGLSALLAMLPHQQTATATAVTASSATGGVASLASGSAKGGTAVDVAALAAGKSKDNGASAKGAEVTTFAAATQQQLAVAPVNTAKVEIETTPTPTAPTMAVVPSAATHLSAAPSGIAAPLINAPLGSPDWQQSVSQHVTLFTRQGQQTAELRLHPEDLGQIQITLKLDDNQAQLQMVSAHSHVRAALEAALPVLRTHLAENGIQLGQSSISSESFAGQQQSSSQQQQAQRSGGNGTGSFAAKDDEPLNVPASLQSIARGNGAVDIFA